MKKVFKLTSSWPVIVGILIATLFFTGMKKVYKITSTDSYCMSCHIHTDADMAWKWSTHTNNSSGVRVHCVDCHLPLKENVLKYTVHKAKHGIKDVYGFYKMAHRYNIGGVVGPFISGRIFDITGNLDLSLIVLIATSVVAAGIAFRLPETGPKAQAKR